MIRFEVEFPSELPVASVAALAALLPVGEGETAAGGEEAGPDTDDPELQPCDLTPVDPETVGRQQSSGQASAYDDDEDDDRGERVQCSQQ
eukprot:SAG22_NODE_1928_length_3293_cov_29.434878_3_plen_90_part_00